MFSFFNSYSKVKTNWYWKKNVISSMAFCVISSCCCFQLWHSLSIIYKRILTGQLSLKNVLSLWLIGISLKRNKNFLPFSVPSSNLLCNLRFYEKSSSPSKPALKWTSLRQRSVIMGYGNYTNFSLLVLVFSSSVPFFYWYSIFRPMEQLTRRQFKKLTVLKVLMASTKNENRS